MSAKFCMGIKKKTQMHYFCFLQATGSRLLYSVPFSWDLAHPKTPFSILLAHGK